MAVPAERQTMVLAHSREQLFRQILDSMAIHVLVVSRRGRVLFASRNAQQFGAAADGALLRAQVGADYLAALATTPGLHVALDGLQSVLDGRTRSFSLEYAVPATSETRSLLLRITPMPAGQGGAIICHFDITDRIRTGQRLQESLERYELATITGRIALWDWELATGVWRADPALTQLLGFEDQPPADQVDSWCAHVHPDDRSMYAAALEAHIRGETAAFEIEHRKVDARGNVRWFLSRAGLRRDEARRPTRLLGLDTEITERKKAEQELLRETRRYHDIFAAAGVAIVEADLSPVAELLHRIEADGITDVRAYLRERPGLVRSALAAVRLIDANPQAVRLAGAPSRQSLLDRWPVDIIIDDTTHLLEHVLALARGWPEYEDAVKLRLPSGELRDIAFVARFSAVEGQLIALIAAHDVTELSSFRRRYEMATSAGSVCVFDYDLGTGEFRADPGLQALFGRPMGVALGQDDLMAQVHPGDRERVQAYKQALLDSDWPRDEAGNSPIPAIEFRVTLPDGGLHWLLVRGTLVRAPEGRLVRLIGTLTDVTTLKRGEASLRRTHRQIRRLTGRLIAAQEAERRRIARELHDDVNQRLAGAAISLSNLQQKLAQSAPATSERVAGLQSEIRSLIIGIRRISHEMHPGILEHAGLEPALRSLCHDLGASHDLEIRVDIYDVPEPLPAHVALCCYRIVQETLHNMTHQRRARACTVRLYAEGDSLILSVREYAESARTGRLAARAGHLDLFSAKGRVRLLGGRLRVLTRPGQGMELRALIPIRAEAPV